MVGFLTLVFILLLSVGFKGRGEILGVYSGNGVGSRVLVGELGGGVMVFLDGGPKIF